MFTGMNKGRQCARPHAEWFPPAGRAGGIRSGDSPGQFYPAGEQCLSNKEDQ